MVVGLPAPLQSVANSSLLIGILSLQLLLSKVTNCLRLGMTPNLGSSTSCRAPTGHRWSLRGAVGHTRYGRAPPIYARAN